MEVVQLVIFNFFVTHYGACESRKGWFKVCRTGPVYYKPLVSVKILHPATCISSSLQRLCHRSTVWHVVNLDPATEPSVGMFSRYDTAHRVLQAHAYWAPSTSGSANVPCSMQAIWWTYSNYVCPSDGIPLYVQSLHYIAIACPGK
jgi:hypothetical protein